MSQEFLDLVADHAMRVPFHPAVMWGDDNYFTFQDLERKSTALAIVLQVYIHSSIPEKIDMNSVKEPIVAIAVDRTQPDWIIAIIACWKVGAGVFLLDNELSAENLQNQIRIANCVGLIRLDENYESVDQQTWSFIVELDAVRDSMNGKNISPFQPFQTPSGYIRYVVFSSGSTGEPKCIALPGEGICSVMRAHKDILGLSSEDRVLQASKVRFDVIWAEFFLLGAKVSLVLSDKTNPTIEELVEYANSKKVTVATFVPSFLRKIKPEALPFLRKIVSTGETAFQELFKKWSSDSERILANGFGPTQATIGISLTRYNDDAVHITQCFPGTHEIHLIDQDSQCFSNERGLIAIESPGLARGYAYEGKIDREKTDREFILLPGTDRRVYQTADLAHYDDAERLIFDGRMDCAVKYHGQFIDLQGVEHHLKKIVDPNGVTDAIYIFPIYEYSQAEDGKILSYMAVVLETLEKNWTISISEVLNQLSISAGCRFPMQFYRLDRMLGKSVQNVKLKRTQELFNSLALTPIVATVSSIDSPLERQVSDLWYSALDIPPELFHIGRDTKFSDLGGDSIQLYQLYDSVKDKFSLTKIPGFCGTMTVAAMTKEITRLVIYQSAWQKLCDSPETSPPIFLLPPLNGSCAIKRLDKKKYGPLFPSKQPQYGMDLLKVLMSKNALVQKKIVDYYRHTPGVACSNITELANYAKIGIQIIQPEGPYFIAGFSFGVYVAVEITRLFLQEKQSVHWLGLIDEAAPKLLADYFKKKTQLSIENIGIILTELGESLLPKNIQLPNISTDISALDNLNQAQKLIVDAFSIVKNFSQKQASSSKLEDIGHWKSFQLNLEVMEKHILISLEYAFQKKQPLLNDPCLEVLACFTSSKILRLSAKKKANSWAKYFKNPIKNPYLSKEGHLNLFQSVGMEEYIKKNLENALTRLNSMSGFYLQHHYELPDKWHHFVGRKNELKMLKWYLNDKIKEPFVLSALPGMGKTRLLSEFCQLMENKENHFIFYVDCNRAASKQKIDMQHFIFNSFQIIIKQPITKLEDFTADQIKGVVTDFYYKLRTATYTQSAAITLVFDNLTEYILVEPFIRADRPKQIKIIVGCVDIACNQSPIHVYKLMGLSTEDCCSLAQKKLENDYPNYKASSKSLMNLAKYYEGYPLAIALAIGYFIQHKRMFSLKKISQLPHEDQVELLSNHRYLESDPYPNSLKDAISFHFELIKERVGLNETDKEAINELLMPFLTVLALLGKEPVPARFLQAVLKAYDGSRIKVSSISINALCHVLQKRGLIEQLDSGYVMPQAMRLLLLTQSGDELKIMLNKIFSKKFIPEFSDKPKNIRYFYEIEPHLEKLFQQLLNLNVTITVEVLENVLPYVKSLTVKPREKISENQRRLVSDFWKIYKELPTSNDKKIQQNFFKLALNFLGKAGPIFLEFHDHVSDVSMGEKIQRKFSKK